MWVDAEDKNSSNIPSAKYCRHHYIQQQGLNYKKDMMVKKMKKRSGQGEGCSSKRRKNTVVHEDELPATTTSTDNTCDLDTIIAKIGTKRNKAMIQIDETGIRPATSFTSDSNKIIEGGSANIGTKRKNVKTTECSGELESFTRTGDPVVELESLEHYKNECVKLSVELEKKNVECTQLQGELRNAETKNNAAKDETDCWRKMFSDLEGRFLTMEKKISSLVTKDPVVELESLEHYKSKCATLAVDLEKKKAEYTTLESKFAELDTKMTAVKDKTGRQLADATECWRKMFSDLESRVVLKTQNVNSTTESLVLRNAKESSILRCVELQNSEKTESQAWDLLNEVTQSGGKPNAETRSGGRKDSHDVYESITKENVPNVLDVGVKKHHKPEFGYLKYSTKNISSGSLHFSSGGENVEEGKGWGCSEDRPSQQHLEMSGKPLVNLVSDDDGESSSESFGEDSHSSRMDMMAMRYRNTNKVKEIKWKFEADMLSSFEDHPELCLKAVCALYRQQISEDGKPAKGLFHYSDALRVSTLAKFLLGGDCKGDLKKSVKDLEIFDSEAVKDCNRLARRYSNQLFIVYQNGEDPYFLPDTTGCPGDQTAK